MDYRIERAGSRNKPFFPTRLPSVVQSMMDKALLAGTEVQISFFLALFLLRPTIYRLVVAGEITVAATRASEHRAASNHRSLFAVRIWREVAASPGTFVRRVDPGSTLAVVRCSSFDDALSTAADLPVERGSDGIPLSRELIELCPRKRVILRQSWCPWAGDRIGL